MGVLLEWRGERCRDGSSRLNCASPKNKVKTAGETPALQKATAKSKFKSKGCPRKRRRGLYETHGRTKNQRRPPRSACLRQAGAQTTRALREGTQDENHATGGRYRTKSKSCPPRANNARPRCDTRGKGGRYGTISLGDRAR